MKIEGGWKEKRLKELEPGDLFYFTAAIYIKTDSITDGYSGCVCIETGLVDYFGADVRVGIIEDAVLKIGGYYK